MTLIDCEEAPLALNRLTYRCEKCSAVTQRILKAEASQAVFVAAMRAQATETNEIASKMHSEMTETTATTKKVIEQSRDMLDKLDEPARSSPRPRSK